MMKIQPLDKTVLTEFKVTVADLHVRKNTMRGSIAGRVSQDSSFNNGDATVTDSVLCTLTNIQSMVVLQAFDNILVSLTLDTQTLVDVPCSGLFVMYGSISQISVRSATPGKSIRLTYVYS